MKDYSQFIPHTSTTVWILAGLVVLYRLDFFLQIFRESICEKPTGEGPGRASIKRIIPMIFALLICYMVVGSTRGRPFNETAFWGLMLFISIATTVLTYAQATGFIDKINVFKGKAIETKSEQVSITAETKSTTETEVQPT